MQSQMCLAGYDESILDKRVPPGHRTGTGVPSGQYEPSGQSPFQTVWPPVTTTVSLGHTALDPGDAQLERRLQMYPGKQLPMIFPPVQNFPGGHSVQSCCVTRFNPFP